MTKKLKLELTERGFAYADFYDLYNKGCSIQESSLATDNAIWLGVYESRMHLNQEQVAELLPLLERFVKTGVLQPRKRK